MHRRAFLAGTATAATGLLAGCGGSAGGGGGGDGPAGATRAYLNALDRTDYGRAQELIHPESPVAGQFPTEEQFQNSFGELSVQVNDLSVVEEGDGMAIVEATVTTEILGDEQTQTQQVELRTHEGSWKIWSGAV